MADEVCATIDYLEDEYKSSNAIDNERFMKLEIERFNHRKALLHGVLCMNVSEDSSSIIHDDMFQPFWNNWLESYIRGPRQSIFKC